MTYQNNFTLPAEIIDQIAQQGMGFIPQLVEQLMNAAMKAEREEYLRAGAYERSEEREGYANGYKPKIVQTLNGKLNLAIPQVREAGFYPEALEKGLRSERALRAVCAEMYVNGVSTRKVSHLVEKIFGCQISASQVSRVTAELDEKLQKWRDSALGEVIYLYLDARYEKIRENEEIRDAAVLIATGVLADGKRKILGISVSLSEQSQHWKEFIERLVARGMRGVRLVISDDHSGLKAARQAIMGGIPWQRCQFHLQQNAQAYVPRKSMQEEVARDIRTIFDAPDRETAESYLKRMIEKYEQSAPKLADWMETNIPEGLTVFSFPVAHRKRIRTNNGIERVNREILRRTRVVSIFPNEASCLRLISAILVETSDEWESGKIYLRIES
jgi:transposase-like protein